MSHRKTDLGIPPLQESAKVVLISCASWATVTALKDFSGVPSIMSLQPMV
jgi:hypothetical protein